MTSLRDAVVEYLTIRRALGFKLREHEWALDSFVSFLERAGASTITTELALQWACDTRGTEGWKAARLSMVRGFAVYLRTIEPATEIPPTGLLLHRKPYAIPYLYSDEEIGRLLAEAAALRPERRAMLHGTVIGLLTVTGMRISEALGLDCDDVDLDAGVLTIRKAKFGKSRQLPLHPTTVQALARYERHREELWPRPWTQSFFVSVRGNRPDKSDIERVFRKLRRRAGLEGARGSPKPRLHDFRHLFAVRTLIDWHRAGIDVQPRLLWLSTYLGHYAGDPVKRRERRRVRDGVNFQAARRRPPGVLSRPVWMNAAWTTLALRRIRERLPRSMIAAAASSESMRLMSRRWMIVWASRARSAGVSSWSRILGITSSPASGSSALTASNSRWRSGVSSCGSVSVSARSSSGSSNRSSNSSRSSSSSRYRSWRAASRAW